MIKIDGYPIDVATSVSYSFPGEATSLAVETGPDISDHMRDLPEEITIEGIVTNTPIGAIAEDDTRRADALVTPIPGRDALERLRQIKADRRVVTLELDLGIFESMALLDLDVPTDKNKGQFDVKLPDGTTERSGALFFTAKFKRLNIISNQRTKIRVKTPMAGAGGKSKVKVVNGSVVASNNVITWHHGSPPGSNNIQLTTFVDVVYEQPTGLTPELTRAHMDSAAEETASTPRLTTQQLRQAGDITPGVTFIRYFDHDAGTTTETATSLTGSHEITGERRIALVFDLQRDQAAQRAENARVNAGLNPKAPSNLPSGIDTDRFRPIDQKNVTANDVVNDFAQNVLSGRGSSL